MTASKTEAKPDSAALATAQLQNRTFSEKVAHVPGVLSLKKHLRLAPNLISNAVSKYSQSPVVQASPTRTGVASHLVEVRFTT
jgi:hypothetical protein